MIMLLQNVYDFTQYVEIPAIMSSTLVKIHRSTLRPNEIFSFLFVILLRIIHLKLNSQPVIFLPDNPSLSSNLNFHIFLGSRCGTISYGQQK